MSFVKKQNITKEVKDAEKHYGLSKENYNIKGESHLSYYKSKHPENYKVLYQYYFK